MPPNRKLYEVEDVIELRDLLSNGADVNELTSFNETPLMIHLIRKSPIEIIKELLRWGADVNEKDCWGTSPVYFAVSRKMNLDIVMLLLDYGADITGKKGGSSDRYLDEVLKKNPVYAELLIKHKMLKNVNKVKSFNCEVDSRNSSEYFKHFKNIIELNLLPSTYLKFSKCLNGCADEVIKMCAVQLFGPLTLFHVVVNKGFPRVFSDRQISISVKLIFDEMQQFNYVYFKDRITSSMGRRLVWKYLESELMRRRKYMNKDTILNPDIMHKISTYLSPVDLANVFLACKF